jgi:2-oxoglutarate ferredoxin oxidoreductase subunit alpha
MKGNEAIAEAAIQAGCRFYAGYPITPQNEIPEYMAKRMPDVDGIFIQAESEIAAINMVFGAAATGIRAMTSSSSPGISLKQEGISFLAGAELPAVIVNIQRGGPGLGNITASQADYFQAVKGGGHGDYRMLVYAPYNLQEVWELTMLAFDKAQEYRNPVMILGDGVIGQMMEPFIQKAHKSKSFNQKHWVLDGCSDRKPRIIRSLYMGEGELEKINSNLQRKYQRMKDKEVKFESYFIDDAEIILVAYGTSARIAFSTVRSLRRDGFKVGLFRPISLFPFPHRELSMLAGANSRVFIAVEMNAGQMVEDVQLAINGKSRVLFYGRPGGVLFTPEDLYDKIKVIATSKEKRAENLFHNLDR